MQIRNKKYIEGFKCCFCESKVYREAKYKWRSNIFNHGESVRFYHDCEKIKTELLIDFGPMRSFGSESIKHTQILGKFKYHNILYYPKIGYAYFYSKDDNWLEFENSRTLNFERKNREKMSRIMTVHDFDYDKLCYYFSDDGIDASIFKG